MIPKFLAKFFFALILLFANNAYSGIKFSGVGSTLALDQANSGLQLQASITDFGGTLKLNTSNMSVNLSNATGAETITFSKGSSIKQGNGCLSLSGGEFNPGTESIVLSGTEVLAASSAATVYPGVSIASGATASIVGSPTFNSSIILADSTTSLNLGVQNTLDQDIVLNGGTVTLFEDLTLAQNTQISGPGTVDAGLVAMKLNSGAWHGDLTFWRARDIQLNGPVSLTGEWSFLTNGSDNVSVLNGNGNTLNLTSGGIILVGDATAGHTLYLSDLHIKGISDSVYTVPGLTQAQYAAIPGLATATVTAGNLAYAAGFTVLAADSSHPVNAIGISIYDDPLGGPLLYGASGAGSGNVFNFNFVTTLNSGPTTISFGSQTMDIDTGTDGSVMLVNGNPGISLYSGSGSNPGVNIYTNPSGWFNAISIGSEANNNIYFVRDAAPSQVYKYLGTPNSWNPTWATGYTNIVEISASNDGYLWIIDNTGPGTYTLTKTNGGAKSGGTDIPLPENPATFGAVSYYKHQSINALSIKGSSANLFGAYCGASGTVYTTTDGLTFTSLGNFGAQGVAVGAAGTLAFMGPNDPANPNYLNSGLAVFVRPPPGINGFSLYDGGATDANRGKIICSNVTFDLATDYTHSAGRITFTDSNSTIVTGGDKKFNITSANGPVQVDGVALEYDTLGGATPISPFASSPNSVALLNNGVVRSATASGGVADLIIPFVQGTTVSLTQNYDLVGNYSDHSGRIIVSNSQSSNGAMIIDGGGYTWNFPSGANQVLEIPDYTRITLKNVSLRGFSLGNVAFGGNYAGLLFGDGVTVEMYADQALTSQPVNHGNPTGTQAGWLFAGNATINGNGHTLTLNGNPSFIQEGVGTTMLTLNNVNLISNAQYSLGFGGVITQFVTLNNCTVGIGQQDLLFGSGNINISGNTKIKCIKGTGTTDDTANFIFNSSGVLTVNSGSTLEIDRGVNIVYAPDTSGDSGGQTGSAAKRHFVIASSADRSGVLRCNNCKIDGTTVGIAFDYGNLIIENTVELAASTSPGYQSELGSGLNLEMFSGSELALQGAVWYTLT